MCASARSGAVIPLDQDLDFSAAFLVTVRSRCLITRVSLKTSRSPGLSNCSVDGREAFVVQFATCIDVEQPATGALRGGRLGDQFRRQCVVEIGESQGLGHVGAGSRVAAKKVGYRATELRNIVLPPRSNLRRAHFKLS